MGHLAKYWHLADVIYVNHSRMRDVIIQDRTYTVERHQHGWFVSVIVNNYAISRTGPTTERMTILRAATHETELGDDDFCLSRSHYTHTDPTSRDINVDQATIQLFRKKRDRTARGLRTFFMYPSSYHRSLLQLE